MKELIRAQPFYGNYVVDSQSRNEDHAENRIAAMPSIVVETGFHTNPSDAEALQDPAFRQAAMKGVEKGFRLHSEGKGCEPLKIKNVPDTTGPRGTTFPVEVHYEGHPQFPAAISVEVVKCPSGHTCTGGFYRLPEKLPSPLTYTFTCAGQSDTSYTYRLRAQLIEHDLVRSERVEHDITCSPSKQTTPSSNATERAYSASATINQS